MSNLTGVVFALMIYCAIIGHGIGTEFTGHHLAYSLAFTVLFIFIALARWSDTRFIRKRNQRRE